MTAALEYERNEQLTLPDWWTGEFQAQLDIEMQYDLNAAVWQGEYVTVQAEPERHDEEAISMDIDRDELYRRLSRN